MGCEERKKIIEMKISGKEEKEKDDEKKYCVTVKIQCFFFLLVK